MTLKYLVMPIAFAVALAASAAPASAQHAGGGGGGHMGGGGGHMGGGGGHMGGGGGHTGGGGDHMGGGGGRMGGGGGHVGGDGHVGERGGHVGGGGRVEGGHSDGRVQGGGGAFHGERHAFNGEFREHGRFGERGDRFEGGREFAHVRLIRPFHGPFFAFRPRFNLGFGLFVGYPVAYPWDYVYPYPYAYGYPYDADPNGWTDNGSDDSDNAYTASAEQPQYGGISLDITPGDASVTVDGTNVGTASTFSPSSAPLTLTPGQHHVVIEKRGYQSMTFDAEVSQGQVTPYQGTMQAE